jgi:hypothetical protein
MSWRRSTTVWVLDPVRGPGSQREPTITSRERVSVRGVAGGRQCTHLACQVRSGPEHHRQGGAPLGTGAGREWPEWGDEPRQTATFWPGSMHLVAEVARYSATPAERRGRNPIHLHRCGQLTDGRTLDAWRCFVPRCGSRACERGQEGCSRDPEGGPSSLPILVALPDDRGLRADCVREPNRVRPEGRGNPTSAMVVCRASAGPRKRPRASLTG